MLKIIHFNLTFGPFPDGRALVEHYQTLSRLAQAQAAAGARVSVLQRFHRDEAFAAAGVNYELRREIGGHPGGRAWTLAPRLTARARAMAADVVQLHGIGFALQARALRLALPSRTSIVVQDHGVKPWTSVRLAAARRIALASVDGIFLNAVEMAAPLRAAGLLPASVPCFAVGEAGSDFLPIPRAEARASTELAGEPQVLWVARLHPIKDPLTAVEGFCRAAHAYPLAVLAMIYQEDHLMAGVRDLVARHGLTHRVAFLGRVPHAELPRYYSSADLFLTAAPWEGSNYALIEAMACGLWPVYSDNPSHRAMLGSLGHCFTAGDPESCRHALERALDAATSLREARAAEVRARFDAQLSWNAIVRQSFAAYQAVRRGRRRRRNQVD